jgi:hypothetical protein
MVRSRRGFARRSLLALLLLAAAGCGKKGPPLPPLRHNPAAAQDLSVYQQGGEWVLQAGYPKTTVAGMTLPGLEAVEVWSMERPAPIPPPPPALAPAAPATPTPSATPTAAPTVPTPSATPTAVPTAATPSATPSTVPTAPTPSATPTAAPTVPTPSATPMAVPTAPTPSATPTAAPTAATPSATPTTLAPPATPAATAPAAAPGPDPREFQAQAKLTRTLRGAELAAAVVGDRLRIRLPAPPPATPSMATVFAIKTVATGGDASAFSNLVSAIPAVAPEPPGGLVTTPRPDGVEVSWTPAVPAPRAYRVYRRDAQARGYGDALHQSPATESSFVDTTAKLGERYVYTVAAVAGETPLVLSALSAEREVDYQDRFAPPPPPGLVALPEGTQVRLRWNASEAADTAGYVVFRQEPGGEFHRVTAEPVTALEYLDSGLAAGNTYRYRVAAVDRSGNEGQPGDAVEGIVR